jgi:hypothetical protein
MYHLIYQACTNGTHQMMIKGEGTAKEKKKKNHHQHLNRSPTDAQVNVSNQQRIPLAAALTTTKTASVV